MSSSAAGHLDQTLVTDAVQALLKYERKRQNESTGGKAKLMDDLAKYIIVQVSTWAKEIFLSVTINFLTFNLILFPLRSNLLSQSLIQSKSQSV